MCVCIFKDKADNHAIRACRTSQSRPIAFCSPPMCVCIRVCVYNELYAGITAQSGPSGLSFYTPYIVVGHSSQLENNNCFYVSVSNKRAIRPCRIFSPQRVIKGVRICACALIFSLTPPVLPLSSPLRQDITGLLV